MEKGRIIKFRGKNNKGQWCYGNLVLRVDGTYLVTPKKGSLIGNYGAVYEETIGQYTGLKDKNGKQIYEGDVVQILGGEYEQGFYEWDERVQIKDLIYDGFNLMMTISQIGNESVEVIGNIYDNPELLKEE